MKTMRMYFDEKIRVKALVALIVLIVIGTIIIFVTPSMLLMLGVTSTAKSVPNGSWDEDMPTLRGLRKTMSPTTARVSIM